MNMTFWQKTKHFDGNVMVDLYNNDKPGFYSVIYNTNVLMPGISLFFKWDNYARENMLNSSFWWPSPRYGIGFNNYMVAPFAGESCVARALYPDYSNHKEFNLDYAKYNNTSFFGFRPYGEESYTGVNTSYSYTIIVYNKCKTADNRDAYIMLCYAPVRRSINSGALYNQTIAQVVSGIYTTTGNTVYSYAKQGVAGNTYYCWPIDRWMDVNFSKSEDYILHPLVVNGCVSDNIYIIDGGMDVLPNLETITLTNKNYFILNRHIAIKIN